MGIFNLASLEIARGAPLTHTIDVAAGPRGRWVLRTISYSDLKSSQEGDGEARISVRARGNSVYIVSQCKAGVQCVNVRKVLVVIYGMF